MKYFWEFNQDEFTRMVVGEGLLVTAFLALRAVAEATFPHIRSGRTLIEGSHPSPCRRIYEIFLGI